MKDDEQQQQRTQDPDADRPGFPLVSATCGRVTLGKSPRTSEPEFYIRKTEQCLTRQPPCGGNDSVPPSFLQQMVPGRVPAPGRRWTAALIERADGCLQGAYSPGRERPVTR